MKATKTEENATPKTQVKVTLRRLERFETTQYCRGPVCG